MIIVYYRGGWEDFNLWFFDIRKQYTSVISFQQGIERFQAIFRIIYEDYKIFWIISLSGTLSVFLTKLTLWKKVFFAGLNIAGFLCVIPGYHFFGHYFLAWVPTVAITGAIFIYSVQEFIGENFEIKSLAYSIPIALIVFPSVYNMYNLSEYYFHPNFDTVLKSTYGANPFPETKVIADKLNTLMKEEDVLLMLGSEVQLYVYTNKKAPTRFAWSSSIVEFPNKHDQEWQQEFIQDVEKANPKYMVYFDHPWSWDRNPNIIDHFMPWYIHFYQTRYNLIGYVDMLPEGSKYIWKPDPEIYNIHPQAEFKIWIYERKSEL